MVREAEEHAGEDKERRTLAEARNQAESAINTVESQLRENGDKIPPGDKQAIETAVTDLRSVLEANNTGEIAEKTQALIQASMKIGEALYGGMGQGGPGNMGGDHAFMRVFKAGLLFWHTSLNSVDGDVRGAYWRSLSNIESSQWIPVQFPFDYIANSVTTNTLGDGSLFAMGAYTSLGASVPNVNPKAGWRIV